MAKSSRLLCASLALVTRHASWRVMTLGPCSSCIRMATGELRACAFTMHVVAVCDGPCQQMISDMD